MFVLPAIVGNPLASRSRATASSVPFEVSASWASCALVSLRRTVVMSRKPAPQLVPMSKRSARPYSRSSRPEAWKASVWSVVATAPRRLTPSAGIA